MPYVLQERRPKLDQIVILMQTAEVKADGDLNYILFKYFLNNITKNYNSIKNYCGELVECAEEIRRRILSEYEDQKRTENGEVI
jgi:hypothetical protein